MPKIPKKNKLKVFKSQLFLGLILTVFILLLLYFFVLPSVVLSNLKEQNILLVSDNLDEQNNKIALVHTSQNSDENLIIFIDGSEVVNIGHDYGDYSLNSIYHLLKIDKKSDQEIKSVFSGVLKIAIDDVVVANGFSNNFEGRKLKMSGSIFNKINLFKIYLLADSMNALDLDQLSDLKNSYHKIATVQVEGYQNCSVAVVNTTATTSLAKQISEVIENTGARVVQVESVSSNLEKTIIFYPEDKIECKNLIEKLMGIFPDEPITKSSMEIPATEQFRSSIVIMVGNDY